MVRFRCPRKPSIWPDAPAQPCTPSPRCGPARGPDSAPVNPPPWRLMLAPGGSRASGRPTSLPPAASTTGVRTPGSGAQSSLRSSSNSLSVPASSGSAGGRKDGRWRHWAGLKLHAVAACLTAGEQRAVALTRYLHDTECRSSPFPRYPLGVFELPSPSAFPRALALRTGADKPVPVVRARGADSAPLR